MTQRVLFLPGLDGHPNSAENVQEHLRDVELIPFTYPTGRALEWGSLVSLVEAKLKTIGTDLIAGESFGSAIALKTAILRNGTVRGLCMLGGFTQEPEAFAAAIGRTATKILPRGLMKPVARMLAAWKLAGGLEGEERQQFLSRFEDFDHAELARRLELLKGFDVSDRLVGVDAVTDVVFGSDDPLAASRSQQQIWKRMPNVRQHQLDGYGHVICAEVPIGVARRIEGWLERVHG